MSRKRQVEVGAAVLLALVILAAGVGYGYMNWARRQEIDSIYRRYLLAFNKNDSRGFAALTTPDFTWIADDGSMTSRNKALQDIRAMMGGGAKWTIRLEQVSLKGDTATARVRMKAVYPGMGMSARWWFEDTWVRMPDGWMLLRKRNVPATPDPD
ncbi:MAG TPA: nuclear transport factor 2 family protein [Armatimonadota bacterium]|nr:nuclear transport factor 2 family protein [Armatimonadota bacterium]